MISQKQKMKMQQKLTPQQLLLMRLLQLPVTSLEQKIKEEVEKNPMLEHVAVPDASQRRFFLEHYGQIGVEGALRLVRHGEWTRRVLLWWANGIRCFSKRAN